MTITANDGRIGYTGNASTTVFAYDFRIDDQAHIEVYLDGVLKTISTHYTVSGVGAAGGGNVTFLTAPGSSVKVLFLRNVPLTQATDYLVGGKFPAETHEAALDKLTMIAQQYSEKFRRALKFATKSLKLDVDGEVDDPVAGKFLQAKNPGPGLEWATPAGTNTALPVPVADGGTGATTAAGARVSLDVPSNAEAILDTLVAAKGDLVAASAANTPGRLPVGADGTLLEADSVGTFGLAWITRAAMFFKTLTTKGDLLVSTGATAQRKAVGANRAILEADSAQADGLAWVARSLGMKSIQVFTAGGTWNRPTGIRRVLVEVVGGGGGGGSTQATSDQFGAGGGGGGFATQLLDVSAIASATITIGAGGSGGEAGSNNGAAGGNSSWADGANTLTGSGGGGGATAAGGAAGGGGGTGTGGAVNIAGGTGGPGQSPTAGNAAGPNQGGASQRGTGAPPTTVNSAGNNAAGFGGGGSGACNLNATARAGGNGSAGIVIVYEYE